MKSSNIYFLAGRKRYCKQAVHGMREIALSYSNFNPVLQDDIFF